MSFTIENDVAMPGRRNRYPFESMKTGQSFQIEGEEEARKVRNAAYQYAKKENTKHSHAKGSAHEVKVALRKTDEVDTGALDAEGNAVTIKVYRLWRE
jgi:hypothetical protein